MLNKQEKGCRWQMAKNLPYKQAIVAYGAAIVGILSQIAYGGCQKIQHWL